MKSVFKREYQHAAKVDPVAATLVKSFEDFLEGGKKLRGAILMLGYEMFGGKDRKQALLASLAVEITQSALLIHDDIMDQDSLRRGKPTMHKLYEKMFGKHYGESMGIIVGDEGFFLASSLLTSLDFPAAIVVKANALYNKILREVGLGQALDISYVKQKKMGEEWVFRIHHYKTAGYTIFGPLAIGAILAGAGETEISLLEEFGTQVGVAFQIHDDELGMFSTEEQLGKPSDSDLREGKLTLLMVKAFEKAKREDLKILKKSYGNKNLTEKDIEKVRRIIKKTGALEYSQEKCQELVAEGKKVIPKITKDRYYQQLLSELADLVIERKF